MRDSVERYEIIDVSALVIALVFLYQKHILVQVTFTRVF